MRLWPRILFPLFFCLLVFSSAHGAPLNYASSGNWAFQGEPAKSGHAVDVFFVCPTAYMGSAEQHNMPVDDPQARHQHAITWGVAGLLSISDELIVLICR